MIVEVNSDNVIRPPNYESRADDSRNNYEESSRPKSFTMIASTILVVTIAMVSNFLGFAFFGYELMGSSLIGAALLGAVGICLNVGKIISYLTSSNIIINFILHILAATFTCLLFSHLIDYNIQSVATKEKNTQIDAQRLDNLKEKLSEFDLNRTKLLELSKEMNLLKNKKVRKDTVWVDSQHCTNDKHPTDCAKIANIKIDIESATVIIQGVDRAKIVGEIDTLIRNNTEITMKKEDFTADQSLVIRIKAVIAPNIDVSVWILSISFMIALLIELSEGIALYPHSHQKHGNTREKSKKKFAKSLVQKLSDSYKKRAYANARLAIAKARAEGRRSAELLSKANSIVSNAAIDIKPYLQVITKEKILSIIGTNDILSSESTARERELLFITWMLSIYESCAPIKIDETINSLKGKYGDHASFLNQAFVSRKLKIMLDAGFIENKSETKNSKYFWKCDEDITSLVKSNSN